MEKNKDIALSYLNHHFCVTTAAQYSGFSYAARNRSPLNDLTDPRPLGGNQQHYCVMDSCSCSVAKGSPYNMLVSLSILMMLRPSV